MSQMPNPDSVELSANEDVLKKVEQVWAVVFQSSNKVIKQAKDYGFLGIELIPSPNIHQILVHLQVFDALIDILLSCGKDHGLEYEQERQLLNAKAQLVKMGQLAAAVKANKKDDFDKALAALKAQAVL